jgi:glyoxylase I family protein
VIPMFIPDFVDHLVFRVAEIDRTERFYNRLLGEPLRTEDYVMYRAGNTLLFFTVAQPSQEPFNKEKVGLNHIALGVRTLEELQTIQKQLDDGGISHSRIKFWRDGRTQYIWLDDPDGFRVEFWLRLSEES